jgi:hypothetical protein
MNILTVGIDWTDKHPGWMLAGVAASALVGGWLLKVWA